MLSDVDSGHPRARGTDHQIRRSCNGNGRWTRMNDSPGRRPRILRTTDGHVLIMSLNRPEKINAFDLAMIDELSAAYDYLARDDMLRVGVLCANGEHFSAGLDLEEMAPLIERHGPAVLAGPGRYDPLGLWKPPVPKPVVMAVSGIAFTLTIELALASEIVVAADDVRFCQLEVGRGLFPFEGGCFRAPLQLGWGNAMKFMLTADEFGAMEALRIGLAQEVVAPGRHVERALQIAHTIARRAPLGVQATLSTARHAVSAARAEATKAILSSLPTIWESDDAQEGLRSFLERRAADFTGC
jgi:enoyl-CoA hydratase